MAGQRHALQAKGMIKLRGQILRIFPGVVDPAWRQLALEKGFDIVARVKDRFHLLLECHVCTGRTLCKVYVVRKNQPLCSACLARKKRKAATAAGLHFLRRDPVNRHYSYYRMSCGHTVRRQIGLIVRAAAGGTGLRCEVCHAAREAAEAQALGWKLIGPDPAGNKSYRIYQHALGCGKEQRIARGNVQTARFKCEHCGGVWSGEASYLYLMKFILPSGETVLKPGFSKNPLSRLRYQLCRRPLRSGQLVRVVAMKTGRQALIAEQAIHGELRRQFPKAVLPSERYSTYLRVKTEVYTTEVEAIAHALLDAHDPAQSPSQSPLISSPSGSANPAMMHPLAFPTAAHPWTDYAWVILQRLRQAEPQTAITWDEDAQLDPTNDTSGATSMPASDASQGEGTTAAPPDPAPPPVTVSEALWSGRLAATFGSAQDFENGLGSGTITILSGIDPASIELVAKFIGKGLIPPDWVANTSGSDAQPGTKSVRILYPEVHQGEVSKTGDWKFRSRFLAALATPAPILILLPSSVVLPAQMASCRPRDIPVAALTADLMAFVLEARFASPGMLAELDLRQALPTDRSLAGLSETAILQALRAPTMQEVIRQLAHLAAPATGPRLTDIAGDGPAVHALRRMAEEIELWRQGRLKWSEMTRSALLVGPPGTGKTHLAKALGNTSGLSLVTASVPQWQAQGHLGDLLAAMHRTFGEARSRRPSVLFLDELDAIGSRIGPDQHGLNYRSQVIAGLLQCIDSLADCEGVLLLGACNFPSLIDPAVVRQGRFDLIIEMPLPDVATIHSIFAQHLTHLDQGLLRDLARRAIGQSVAAVEAGIRAAKGEARARGNEVYAGDLEAALGLQNADAEVLWRSAIHEIGHVLVTLTLGRGRIEKVRLMPGGGEVLRRQAAVPSTLQGIECELTVHLAGRAAETLIFGVPSGGSGGPPESDLALATDLAVRIDFTLGLGPGGPVWRSAAGDEHLRDPETHARVRTRIEAAEHRALKILAPQRDRLLALAKVLVNERELSGPGLQDLLSDSPGLDRDPKPGRQAI